MQLHIVQHGEFTQLLELVRSIIGELAKAEKKFSSSSSSIDGLAKAEGQFFLARSSIEVLVKLKGQSFKAGQA